MSQHLTINLSGHLMSFDRPKVMGILNVTPDSFFDGGKYKQESEIARRIQEIIEEGADFIDVGGCSTRPGSEFVEIEEEWQRVCTALHLISEIDSKIPVSLDTFHSEIARRGVEEFGVKIINDISGGEADGNLWPTVADLHVPYVLTHSKMRSYTILSHEYEDVTAEVIKELSFKTNELHRLGVNDVIIDPGFGFSKTFSDNFRVLDELEEFKRMGLPLLVGLSRKSFIYKSLKTSPDNALTGTIALDTIALMKGADILRVHDVKEAVETVELFMSLKKNHH